jgi:hypothetical protein
MTDDERHLLCADLRADAAVLTARFAKHNRMAAAELERLAKELAKAHKLCGQMLQDQHKHARELEMALAGRSHPENRW